MKNEFDALQHELKMLEYIMNLWDDNHDTMSIDEGRALFMSRFPGYATTFTRTWRNLQAERGGQYGIS